MTAPNSTNVGGLVGFVENTADAQMIYGNYLPWGLYWDYATGSVTGKLAVGGLFGQYVNPFSDYLSASFATGAVSGGDAVGGLIGIALGHIEQSYATGSVSATGVKSYAARAGGLVGYSSSTLILNSYATGDVTATISGKGSVYAGGLVGQLEAANLPLQQIDTSYASGLVNNGSGGGLIGGASGSLPPSDTVWGVWNNQN
ncbi:large exoproteins involved in heme utilization or adhesion, partial [Cupriavidus basilensis OR16]